jgi:hypothetical protein
MLPELLSPMGVLNGKQPSAPLTPYSLTQYF